VGRAFMGAVAFSDVGLLWHNGTARYHFAGSTPVSPPISYKEDNMFYEIGFYQNGPQAGSIGWVKTSAGTYFIGTNGKMSGLY